jgi:hypothetical protein
MLFADEFELGDVVGAAGGEGAGSGAALKVGYFGGEVAGFEVQFGGASLHADGEGAMLTRRQGCVTGFEIEGNEDDSESGG